jgi:transglutaminase-like putative cysteine protease
LVPGGKAYQEPAPPERALVRTRIDASAANLHSARIQLEYRATLRGRELVPGEHGRHSATSARLLSAERERFLAANSLFDFREPEFERFTSEHSLARRSDEGEVAYARRVFLALKRHLHYEYHWTMDRRATQVARTWSSDCAGMSVLFTSLMRAHSVPARVLAGRWARSSKPGAIVGDVQYYQQHVKAEFYAEHLGWVPVDLSSAVEHDHTPAGLQYFGRDQGNFLTIHIDPLVQVDTLHFGRQTFTWLQGVHYYASGKGSLRNKVIDEQWQVNWLGPTQSSLIGGSSSRL